MYQFHGSFIASEGNEGWYTTIEDNEIIEFKYGINSLLIESKDTSLAIKINNNENIWYINPDSKEGINGMRIHKIQVLKPSGTALRWKGLTY